MLSTPEKPSRYLSSELSISDRSVRRLLKELNMRLDIMTLLQSLHGGDADTRLVSCEILLNKVNEVKTFLDKIWWAYGATFKLNGFINHHNYV